jgi:hypothetical protein
VEQSSDFEDCAAADTHVRTIARQEAGTMSIAQLHELAAALDQQKETARSEDHVRPADFELLATTILQAVHELMNMEQRLASMERQVLRRLDDEALRSAGGSDKAPRQG